MKRKQNLKGTFVSDDTEYCKSLAQVSRSTGIKYHRVLDIKNVLVSQYRIEWGIHPHQLFHSGYDIDMFIDMNKDSKYRKVANQLINGD